MTNYIPIFHLLILGFWLIILIINQKKYDKTMNNFQELIDELSRSNESIKQKIEELEDKCQKEMEK